MYSVWANFISLIPNILQLDRLRLFLTIRTITMAELRYDGYSGPFNVVNFEDVRFVNPMPSLHAFHCDEFLSHFYIVFVSNFFLLLK